VGLISIFSDNLKKYRVLAGYSTAKEFAAVLNVPYPTYVSYESNGREPKYELLCKISDCLHISTDKLLGHEVETDFEEIREALLLAGIDVKRTGKYGPRWGEILETTYLPEVYGENARTIRNDWYYLMPLTKRILADCKADMNETVALRLRLIFDLNSFNNTPGTDRHIVNAYLDQFAMVTNNLSDRQIHDMMEGITDNPFLNLKRKENTHNL